MHLPLFFDYWNKSSEKSLLKDTYIFSSLDTRESISLRRTFGDLEKQTRCPSPFFQILLRKERQLMLWVRFPSPSESHFKWNRRFQTVEFCYSSLVDFSEECFESGRAGKVDFLIQFSSRLNLVLKLHRLSRAVKGLNLFKTFSSESRWGRYSCQIFVFAQCCFIDKYPEAATDGKTTEGHGRLSWIRFKSETVVFSRRVTSRARAVFPSRFQQILLRRMADEGAGKASIHARCYGYLKLFQV